RGAKQDEVRLRGNHFNFVHILQCARKCSTACFQLPGAVCKDIRLLEQDHGGMLGKPVDHERKTSLEDLSNDFRPGEHESEAQTCETPGLGERSEHNHIGVLPQKCQTTGF